MDRPWLKSYPEGVRSSLSYPEVPAYHFLFEHSAKHPDRTALIFLDKKITYRQLGEMIDRFAAAISRRLGMRPGDRVGMILPNCPQAVIALYGCMRAGVTPVPFNPLYVSREIACQIQDAGCRIMITLDLLWPKVREAGGVEQFIQTSVADFLPFPKNILYPLKAKPPKIPLSEVIRFRDLLREDTKGFIPAPVNPREDPAVLLYTGGTTGASKGVMTTHFNLTSMYTQISEWLQQPPDRIDRVVVVMPLFHSFGLSAVLNYTLSRGSTAILVPRFESRMVLDIIAKYKPTSLPGVPTIYTALLKEPDIQKFDLKSLELCVSGAAPLPVELMQRFEQMTGASILEGYGLTETSPATHGNPMYGRRVPGSVGLPYPDTDVRIIDLETGADVPPNTEGEILLRGPQLMKGYWNNPQATAEAIRDGWLHTGDIGKMDEDGYLYIVDRKKDMIIAGGFNIYPREIDEVLYEHPAVLEACSVGVPDEYRGETVKAFVVLKPGASATAEEILEHCKQKLAAYKRPRSVEFLSELPKSAVGKVLRRVLAQRERERAMSAAARQ